MIFTQIDPFSYAMNLMTPFYIADDPMTLLTFGQMALLVAWWHNPDRGDELVLGNQTCSGGTLAVTVDPASGVWVNPVP